ncbi:MAG: Prolyl tripeptidyl peptidase precursor [Verrucomicrobiota bacterium]
MIRFQSVESPRLRWRCRPRIAGWTVLLLACLSAFAQGSRPDYQRAMSLAQRTENTVFRASIQPQWIAGGGGRFWYRVTTGPDRQDFVFVDPERGTREPLFDPAALATRLTTALGNPVLAESLKLDSLTVELEGERRALRFRQGGKRWKATIPELVLESDPKPEDPLPMASPQRIPKRSRTTGEETEIILVNRTTEDVELYWLDDQGTRRPYGRLRPGAERRQHTFAGHVWLGTDRNGSVLGAFTAQESEGRAEFVNSTNGARTRVASADPPPGPQSSPQDSPDGKWTVELIENNLFLRPKAGGEAVRLSRDGTKDDAYHSEVQWSPDSTHLVARRVQGVSSRLVSWIEAAPKDQLQPKVHSHTYPKPGDPLPHPRLRVFAVDGCRQYDVDEKLYPNPFTESGALDVDWAPDSREFYVNYKMSTGRRTAGNSTSTTTNEVIRCTGSWPSTAPARSAPWSRKPRKPWWTGPPRPGGTGSTRVANWYGCPSAAVGVICGASTSPPAP